MSWRLKISSNSVNCTPPQQGFRVGFCAIVCGILGTVFFSHSVYAGTNISVANSNNVIAFDKVQSSSSGTVTTASDTLTITTDCSAGSNVYISAVSGSSSGTSLVNNAADSNNTISALSGTTIGSTALALSNNTWGFNTDNSASGANNGNGIYYGLPTYANAMEHAIYSGTNTTIPIYYDAKVTNTLTPEKYSGEVLYTATVNSSCLFYTVSFNKNAVDATGSMNSQSIPPSTATPLTTNAFERPGYVFLGWSADQNATTPTYTDGKTSGSSPRDICPKGWRLPTGSNDDGEFQALNAIYGSNSYDQFTGLYTTGGNGGFDLAGSIESGALSNVGSSGRWWSSTASSSSYGYNLYLYNSSVNATISNYRNLGYSVCCIAKHQPEDCTRSLTPGTTADTACKMKDGHLWAYGNNGTAIYHNAFCPDGVNCNNSAQYCPAGFIIPSQEAAQNLINVQGDTTLYTIMYKRNYTQWNWIDNPVVGGWVTAVYLASSKAQFGGMNYEYLRSGRVLCYK